MPEMLLPKLCVWKDDLALAFSWRKVGSPIWGKVRCHVIANYGTWHTLRRRTYFVPRHANYPGWFFRNVCVCWRKEGKGRAAPSGNRPLTIWHRDTDINMPQQAMQLVGLPWPASQPVLASCQMGHSALGLGDINARLLGVLLAAHLFAVNIPRNVLCLPGHACHSLQLNQQQRDATNTQSLAYSPYKSTCAPPTALALWFGRDELEIHTDMGYEKHFFLFLNYVHQ